MKRTAALTLRCALLVATALFAYAQNCAQYANGSLPVQGLNLQNCCSQGSFAASDPYCQQNPQYFVFSRRAATCALARPHCAAALSARYRCPRTMTMAASAGPP
jgi:hypothetical protein